MHTTQITFLADDNKGRGHGGLVLPQPKCWRLWWDQQAIDTARSNSHAQYQCCY